MIPSLIYSKAFYNLQIGKLGMVQEVVIAKGRLEYERTKLIA